MQDKAKEKVVQNLDMLIDNLVSLPAETEYVEFKHNFSQAEEEAKDICALANSAAFHDAPAAYKIWGIEDSSHKIVGTNFNPKTKKKGNQELELWLRQHVSSNCYFEFHEIVRNGLPLVVLKIWPAFNQPVKYDNIVYIRTGSSTQKLETGSSRETELWKKIQKEVFEDQVALEDVAPTELADILDCNAYFDLLDAPRPQSPETVAHFFLEEGMAAAQDNGLISITNLGALLFARDLSKIPTVRRKKLRVLQYDGNGRIGALREREFSQGYALTLDSAIDYIDAIIPSRDVIQGATRVTRGAYPSIAIRELVANALTHQDFNMTGTGPIVELFDNRIEITNPGSPLVDVDRIVNDPPRSRNERTASLLRRLGFCEEAGSGWDKIIAACEHFHMPAPAIEIQQERSMRVTLRQTTPFKHLTPQERLDACYWHACICYAQGSHVTNQSLRERFDVKSSNAAQISRLIKEAIEAHLIKPVNPDTSPRYREYLPDWA